MDTPKIATSELFGAPSPRRYKIVGPLPVRGCHVRIQSLTEAESQDYQLQVLKTSGGGFRQDRLRDANRRLIGKCLVNEEGNQFVTEAQLREMAAWDNMDTTFLYDECAKHAGINKSDIEDLVKNSEGTPAAG